MLQRNNPPNMLRETCHSRRWNSIPKYTQSSISMVAFKAHTLSHPLFHLWKQMANDKVKTELMNEINLILYIKNRLQPVWGDGELCFLSNDPWYFIMEMLYLLVYDVTSSFKYDNESASTFVFLTLCNGKWKQVWSLLIKPSKYKI